MKYNIGDVVEIKTWKEMEEEFGLTSITSINEIDCEFGFTSSMQDELQEAKTRIVEIREIANDTYYVNLNGNEWENWSVSDDMIKRKNLQLSYKFNFLNQSI